MTNGSHPSSPHCSEDIPDDLSVCLFMRADSPTLTQELFHHRAEIAVYQQIFRTDLQPSFCQPVFESQIITGAYIWGRRFN
jgi:hypothetical protein